MASLEVLGTQKSCSSPCILRLVHEGEDKHPSVRLTVGIPQHLTTSSMPHRSRVRLGHIQPSAAVSAGPSCPRRWPCTAKTPGSTKIRSTHIRSIAHTTGQNWTVPIISQAVLVEGSARTRLCLYCDSLHAQPACSNRHTKRAGRPACKKAKQWQQQSPPPAHMQPEKLGESSPICHAFGCDAVALGVS